MTIWGVAEEEVIIPYKGAGGLKFRIHVADELVYTPMVRDTCVLHYISVSLDNFIVIKFEEFSFNCIIVFVCAALQSNYFIRLPKLSWSLLYFCYIAKISQFLAIPNNMYFSVLISTSSCALYVMLC